MAMELLPVDSEERLARAKKVWDRIAEKNRQIEAQLRDLDNVLEKDNGDAYSDLSDPFSDMGDSEFARPASKKVSFGGIVEFVKQIELFICGTFPPTEDE